MEMIKNVVILQCDIMNIMTKEIENKQDILVMEDVKGARIVLNLTTGVDMTKTYWKPIIVDNNKNKVAKIKQELFKNSAFNN